MTYLDQSTRVSQTGAMVCSAYKPMRRRLDSRGDDVPREIAGHGVQAEGDMSQLVLERRRRACGGIEITS